MASFFKTFFLGILYIVLLPFIAALLAIYFVYCLFVFIYMAIRCVVIFFAGGYPLGDLPEDVEAKKILAQQAQAPMYHQPSYQQYPSYGAPQPTYQEPYQESSEPSYQEPEPFEEYDEHKESSMVPPFDEYDDKNDGGESL